MDEEADHLQGILDDIKSRQVADAERAAKTIEDARQREADLDQEKQERYGREFQKMKAARIQEYTITGRMDTKKAERMFEQVDRSVIESSLRKVVGLE